MRWVSVVFLVFLVACVSIAATTSEEEITKIDDSRVQVKVTNTEVNVNKIIMSVPDMQVEKAKLVRQKSKVNSDCAINNTMLDRHIGLWDARIIQAETILGR